MKLIKSILTVVKKIKEFPDRKTIILINIIFEKQRTVSFIKLEIQNTVNIPSLITIFNNNRLIRFLPLIKRKVSSYITQKSDIEY